MTEMPISSVRKRPDWTAPAGAVLTALLIALGGWQLGHGLYIKAKAQLAQMLLDSAWEDSLRTGTPQTLSGSFF